MKQEIITKIVGKTLKLTNLDKLYWPASTVGGPKEKPARHASDKASKQGVAGGYTKGDLIEYYQKISAYILPYLKDRPESLNRHPGGINGPNFFQKDVDHQPPAWAKTKSIYSESHKGGSNINYLLCQNTATLIYMANLGCIEINPWFSTTKHLDKPDYAVIDLDPEDIGFDKVIETALEVHKLLEKIKVPNYCKTSGATGLHVYIPLGAKYTYDQAKEFSHIIAVLINRKLPNTTSVERMPKKRQKKVYLDFLQNRKGQTLAAPYSVRPKPGAPVSTPLEWGEVRKGLDPKNFTIKTIFPRLEKKKDLFKPVLGKGIDLKKSLSRIEKLNS